MGFGLMPKRGLLALVGAAMALFPAWQAAAEGQLNLYSSRHYDTDERLYSDFTDQTGITINRIEDSANVLIERLRAEGRNSPADILITVDAGRLWLADEAGLFQPIQSDVLEKRIPSHLRHPEGKWFAFSSRARIIFYDRAKYTADRFATYESLADPSLKAAVCTRSSSNIYMLSLMASIIHHKGEEAARSWAAGLWNNRARDPQGGDTDQLRAIVSGECGVVLANSYYFARALRTDVRGLSKPADKIGWVFPNQDGRGAHINISGAGVAAHAPNKDNAVKFLEYLSSDSAQKYFSQGNDEFPVVEGVERSESADRLGDFKSDTVDITVLGKNQAAAQRIYDEVGYK